MEKKEISENKENPNISPVKKQTELFLPPFTKSYCKTSIESTTFSYVWEIDKFVHLSKTVDLLHSSPFPETSNYMIQMNVIRTTELFGTIHFFLLSDKTFVGLCTTTITFPHQVAPLSRSISGRISTMEFLFEITKSYYGHCSDTDTLVIHCKFEEFRALRNNTIHLNLQPPSTMFSEYMRSFNDFDNKSEDEKPIKFIVGEEKYIISKKLLRATNSIYFKTFRYSTDTIYFTNDEKYMSETVNFLPVNEVQTFQEMLFFITTGSIRSNNYDMLQKLLITAHKYDVSALKLTCEHYLLRYITICNVTELILLAFSSHAKFLETQSATFIKFHYKEVMNTKEFQDLPLESVTKIMKLIEKCELLEMTAQFISSRLHIT